jgi:hypothetical protein
VAVGALADRIINRANLDASALMRTEALEYRPYLGYLAG